MKKVFVKKDVHPSIRDEWKRLDDVFNREKSKDCNIGRSVNFNKIERTITIDNIVIDKWSPQDF